MTFNVTYSDLGGLTGPNADSTTNNSRVCFDKTAPVISRVSNISNNIYSDSLAKIGDTDTIKFTISEIYRSVRARRGLRRIFNAFTQHVVSYGSIKIEAFSYRSSCFEKFINRESEVFHSRTLVTASLHCLWE